jgi:hypothetical protein
LSSIRTFVELPNAYPFSYDLIRLNRCQVLTEIYETTHRGFLELSAGGKGAAKKKPTSTDMDPPEYLQQRHGTAL